MIVDTHLHLNTEDYDHDLNDVIKDAYTKGVEKLIVIGMDKISSEKALEIAHAHDSVYATIGLHPGYVDEGNTDFIESMLNDSKVVGIGETGLDLYWQQDNLKAQQESFLKHIELSIKHQMPLVIHTRNSFKEAYDMLLPYKGKVFGVFHCFSSNLEDAKKAIDLGFYIGIDGPITFKNPKDLLPIVKHIDLKHILVETDSPYLAPSPYRGKRNQPGYLIEVVKKIADIKQMTYEEVSQITTSNAHQLFGLGGYKNET